LKRAAEPQGNLALPRQTQSDIVIVGATFMSKTVTLTAEIPASRELRIKLPADVPTGSAEIVVTVSSAKSFTVSTFGDFLESEFFGMWRERAEIKDSAEFANNLRWEGWKRAPSDEPR